MTAKPVVADPVVAKLDAIALAQAAAAKGGWPAAPSCEFRARRKTFWAWTIATFFGSGLGKPGPGTWGSIAATLIWAGVAWLGAPAHSPNAYFVAPYQIGLLAITLGGIILSIALGVPAATIAARESGRKDPGFVVIDEVAGVWITLLGAVFHPNWKHIVVALLLFRVFDIWKPFPIRHLEKLPEGWGIVFDDVAAGLYAWAVLVLLNKWL